MDVKFITVRKSNLNTVPVVDGQIVAVEDSNGFYYDMNSERRPVSALRVFKQLEGVGREGEVYVETSGDAPGVYVWDVDQQAYVLVANKDTDTYLSLVKNSSIQKVYLSGTNGDSESKDLYWNDNVHMDLLNGTVTATEFKGKASDSYKADEAKHAQSAESSKTAEVASKIGTTTVGSPFTAVYVLNGVPTQCNHSVMKDVPEDAVFTDTPYDVFNGATTDAAGSTGLVPAPSTANVEQFLKGDGTWSDVYIPDMTGCTSSTDGKNGLVPKPSAGQYNHFLKGDGTWASYSAGYGLDLVSLTFNLKESGVIAGTYGPVENADEMTTYRGDFVPVPRITVDKYGRVTSVTEVPCYLTGSSPDPSDEASLMKFSFTEDGSHLLCTYDDVATALAKFEISDDGHLIAEYQYDPTPMTLSMNEEGHIIATKVGGSESSEVAYVATKDGRMFKISED